MPTLWAGIDAGKRTRHCVVIDCDGSVLLSRKIGNDETGLLDLIAAVIELAENDDVCWATDLTDGGAALLIALLVAHAQRLLYIPGRIVHHAAATYRGDDCSWSVGLRPCVTGPTIGEPECERVFDFWVDDG